jgi:hypothetical protein
LPRLLDSSGSQKNYFDAGGYVGMLVLPQHIVSAAVRHEEIFAVGDTAVKFGKIVADRNPLLGTERPSASLPRRTG